MALVRLPPGNHVLSAALCVTILLVLADLAWRRLCAAAPACGSWARGREALAALLFINDAVFTLLDLVPALAGIPSAGRAAATHVLQMCLASRWPTHLFLWGTLPRIRCGRGWAAAGQGTADRRSHSCHRGSRAWWCAHDSPARLTRVCSWSLPLHLLVVTCHRQYSGVACSSAALNGPAAQPTTAALAKVFSMMKLHPAMPPPAAMQPTPAEECHLVLTSLQLMLSLAVPALVQAAVEARLFQRHQEQRQQHGLPLERGIWPALYGAINWLLLCPDWTFLVPAALSLLGALHMLAVLLTFDVQTA